VRTKPPFDAVRGLHEKVSAFEHEMNGSGRVLIRYSGTEPLARVMIEGSDGERIQVMADELAGVIRSQLG
jgi:phosphoglucosamine mutase